MIFASVLLSGCVQSINTTECTWARPVMMEATDVIGIQTLRQIVYHNGQWVKNCGKNPR